MRVLFAASPLIGHVFPMMPLALQMMRDGHSVLLATGADAAERLDPVLPVASVATPMTFGVPIRALALHPSAARSAFAGNADPRVAGRIAAQLNRPIRDAMTATAREFKADIIVHEPFAAAAALAAAALDIPAVLHNIGLDHGERIIAEALACLGPARVPPHAAALSIAPPSVVTVPGWPLRYVPYSHPSPPPPDWLNEPCARPRILVTRSTMIGDGRTTMLTSILRAASDVDAEFVIVRPDRRMDRRRHLPDNVRTVGWTVLRDVLPHCTAMVNHGGAGSVYAALHAGIPQIATPDTGDRGWNARSVEQRGAGLAVRARSITPAHLHELVHNTNLAHNARQVAAEISAMPDPKTLSSQLDSILS